MNHIRDAGKVRARDRIAVLAALNLTFDLVDPSKTASRAPATVSEPNTTGDDPRLSALLARLDSALNIDTPLL